MEDNPQNRLILALIGVGIGVTGIVAYHESVQWLLNVCAVLSLMQWIISIVKQEIQKWSYPYLAACLLAGYYITGTFENFLFYGICLYYATGILYSGLLRYVPNLLFMVVPIFSIVAFFMNYEHVFMIMATFCTAHFIIAHFSGKTPHYAMDNFLLCVAFGIGFMVHRNTDSLYTIRIVKSILWAGSAQYIIGIIHVFIHALINRN